MILPTTYGHALQGHIVPTEHHGGGYTLASLEPYWLVVRLFDYPAEHGYPAHKELAFWCGSSWSYEWDNDMLLYAYRQAVMVADDLGGLPLNFADLLRDEDAEMGGVRGCGTVRHTASVVTLAKLRTQGRFR